jgi:protein ImuB
VLWIALHLPLLSLESFAATLTAGQAHQPLALMDAQQIVSANPAALALGVRPGLKRATALALAPQILLGQADAARDAQALVAITFAALAFTPAVSLQARADGCADTVLLEVQASLRYFGGLERLLQRLQATLVPLGHRMHVASAPTPLGAALLARVHRRLHCADLAALRRSLDAGPVWLLGPGREHWEVLQGMGLRTLADLRKLPRAGLARRFGQGLLAEVDAAFGERPDPREAIVLPGQFECRLELFARADTTAQVLHGAGVLLARLVAWLAAQHAMVRSFTLAMQHEPRWRADAQVPGHTELAIALAEPSRDATHLQTLLRERLASLQLPAPTLELRLRAGAIVQRAAPNTELFPTAASEHEGLVRLVERLQARLGPAQVQRLRQVHDHRPECASQTLPADLAAAGLRRVPAPRAGARAVARVAAPAPDCASTRAATPIRPVWLLSPPEPLAERDLRPWLDGRPLQLLSGPERIESGWWDHALAERDYFIAQAADSALVWIFRARLPPGEGEPGGGWFLQGRFA